MRTKKDFQNGSSMMPHHFQVSYSFFLRCKPRVFFVSFWKRKKSSGRCAKRGLFSRGNQHSDAEPLGDAALPPSSQSLLADEELCIYTN